MEHGMKGWERYNVFVFFWRILCLESGVEWQKRVGEVSVVRVWMYTTISFSPLRLVDQTHDLQIYVENSGRDCGVLWVMYVVMYSKG